MDEEFQDFIADPRLRKVMEGLKRSNDIFDIIKHNENQHSEILKWLFDPREGHGQGDAILKDFLTAAYKNAGDNVLCNKEFFAEWTPSRISRTGFHSMIALREYVLSSQGRLDLLMIDTVNQILLVIENKHGARLGPAQLESYYEEVASLRARPAFKGYKTAHIVLDRNFGGASDEEANRSGPRNRWTFLDYMWLQAGAERAELQSKRGNQSASLVIAYCQKQTDYIPPEQKEINDILANIAMDYRAVVKDLEAAYALDVGELTKGIINGDVGEKWIFANHYPELVERLCSKEKLSFVESWLRGQMSNRSFVAQHGKRYVALFDKEWHKISDDVSDTWPVYVTAWEMPESVHGTGKFAVAIKYHKLSVNEDHRVAVQSALEAEFSELKKGPQNASFRMLGKITNLGESNLTSKVQGLYERLVKALGPVLANVI